MKNKIGIIVGSLRKESINRKLATGVMKLASENLEMEMIEIAQLSMYNQDYDENPPADWIQLRNQIKSFDGIIFVTPEYNRSVPGFLKNAIDVGSRPYGHSVWAGKPAGVLGASIGAIGSALAQQHLRNILAYLDMPTMGQPEAFAHIKEGFFEADGSIGPESKKFFQKWLSKYEAWVAQHSSKQAATADSEKTSQDKSRGKEPSPDL